MKKIQLEEKLHQERRLRKFTKLVFVIPVILSIAQLLLSNHLASFSATMMSLQTEEDRLTFENELLSKDIASQSSLTAVEKRAEALSFQKASKQLVISNSEPVALAPSH